MTVSEVKTALVDWFNQLPAAQRSVVAGTLPFYRAKVYLTSDTSVVLVIGEQDAPDDSVLQSQHTFLWMDGVGDNLTATATSFVELASASYVADDFVAGATASPMTTEGVLNTKLINLEAGHPNNSTYTDVYNVTSMDTISQAISKLANSVGGIWQHINNGGTSISDVTGLSDRLATLDKWAGSPVKQIAGTAYTLSDIDAGYFIEFTASSPVTVTIPTHESGAIANTTLGQPFFHICQAGTGKVTIVADTGVTLRKPASQSASTAEQHAVLTVKRTGYNIYRAFGLLTSP